MIFNSYIFLFIFFPIMLSIFYMLIKYGFKNSAVLLIGISSVIFYSFEGYDFLHILLISIIFNFIIGNSLRSTKSFKKIFLIIGVCFNIGLLFYFKYYNFFLSTLDISSLSIILPIGISFYTFTQIAFIADCYNTETKSYSFTEYLCFVTFFPHLIAGPILIHKNFIPQLRNNKFGKPSYSRIYAAVIFFSVGMFKKVMIADTLSPYVSVLFLQDNLTLLEAWSAALLYTFQLYYDFSAYSEMAVGLALLMNLKIPINFNSPYKSTSIIDFWRRWHISLSFFLKNYLYIPLGGNKLGKKRKYLNLFITMVIGGIWHGAGYTFAVWGILHGLYLCINHYYRQLGLKINNILSWLITFIAVVISWVFFRSPDIQTALNILRSMFGFGENSLLMPNIDNPFFTTIAILSLLAWLVIAPNTRQIAISRSPKKIYVIISALILYFSILNFTDITEFIYFQF